MNNDKSPSPDISSKINPTRLFRWLLDFLAAVTENFDALLLGIMTLVITWQVISRYNPHINSPWTEETALILLVWFGLTGAAIGVRKGIHIGIEFFFSLMPEKVQRFLNVFTGLLILMFSSFLLFEGITLAQGTWTIKLAATLLPRGVVVYLAVPVASALMILYSLELVLQQFKPRGGNQK